MCRRHLKLRQGEGWAVFVDAHLVADLFVVGGEVPPEGDVGIGHRVLLEREHAKEMSLADSKY